MKWRPIFSPSPTQSYDWKLPTMISFAVFMHGLAFYLVQADTPVSKTDPVVSARVSTLDTNRPADLQLLHWVENHDPATILRSGRDPALPGVTMKAAYQPSYESHLPDPLPIHFDDAQSNDDSLFPPGPVPMKLADTSQKTGQAAELPTRIIFSNSIRIASPPSLNPPKINDNLPLPTQFLIVPSLSDTGDFFFLMHSSGAETLDDYARRWLAAAKPTFGANQSSGWITFHWGKEIQK